MNINEIRSKLQQGKTINEVCKEYHLTLRKDDKHYGTYYSLEDAIKVRDYFIYNGWRKDKVDKVCDELGVIRSKDVGRRW